MGYILVKKKQDHSNLHYHLAPVLPFNSFRRSSDGWWKWINEIPVGTNLIMISKPYPLYTYPAQKSPTMDWAAKRCLTIANFTFSARCLQYQCQFLALTLTVCRPVYISNRTKEKSFPMWRRRPRRLSHLLRTFRQATGDRVEQKRQKIGKWRHGRHTSCKFRPISGRHKDLEN